ncbi:MAG: methyltransferase domain-containing protein [Bacteroidetes bacterium]|jgi:16S rRNA (guanine(966)-N(2))-methyltransferase RsmD|nr:methyltransferase domain-containing protein [Bacteroidota bacterium]
MRIISGSEKGRKLLIPKKLPARPTTDFAKESLFNILRNQFDFEELSVLDLFSGTGSISYEFASRGVPSIVTVDSHRESVRYVERTAESFSFPIQAFRMDVFQYLEKANQRFSIIFSDPPYDMDFPSFEKIISLVFEKSLLAEDGLLIVEHHKKMDLSTLLNFQNSRKYGDTVFSFFGI